MTGILGIFQLIVCVGILFREYNCRSVAVFFWGMNCIIFAIPHAIDCIMGKYSFKDTTMMTASAFVIAFSLIYILFRQIRLSKSSKISNLHSGALDIDQINIEGPHLKEYVCVAAAVFLGTWVAFFSRSNFGGLGNASWGAIYSAQSGLSTPVFALAPYLFATIAGAVVILWKNRRLFSLAILLLSSTLFLLITRNRVVMLSMACPLCLLLASRYKKLSIKDMIIGVILVLFLVYIVYAILIFRHAGTLESFISEYNLSTFNQAVFSSMLAGEGELGLRNILYYFIENHNNFAGFSQGASYVRILLFWLPSNMSQGIKPDDFAITMASAYLGNPFNTTYSVHPTFFGDAYANYGFVGCFLGVVWGLAFNCFDAWMRQLQVDYKVYIVSIWAYALIVIGRGSVYNGVMIGIVSTLFAVLLSKLSYFINPGHTERRFQKSPHTKVLQSNEKGV